MVQAVMRAMGSGRGSFPRSPPAIRPVPNRQRKVLVRDLGVGDPCVKVPTSVKAPNFTSQIKCKSNERNVMKRNT